MNQLCTIISYIMNRNRNLYKLFRLGLTETGIPVLFQIAADNPIPVVPYPKQNIHSICVLYSKGLCLLYLGFQECILHDAV